MPVPSLGVVVVTFNAADVILECLESLLAARDVRLEIVVVDNASTDGTVTTLRDWASGSVPFAVPGDMPFALTPAPKPVALRAPDAPLPGSGHAITLIETGVNGGFAGGVNIGLAHLASRAGIDRFWVLNPDSVVPPDTPAAFASHPAPEGGFSLMSGRVVYHHDTDMIQSDGGTVNARSGVTSNIHLGASYRTTPAPEAGQLDFVTGASMVASRQFYEAAGPMEEGYFLYYEEVDWALSRGDLPLAYCPQALVYHKSGTSIGSPTLSRLASPFSLYFMYRARMWFVRKFHPQNSLYARAYALAKAGQLLTRGYWREPGAIARAALGMGPPRAVRARLTGDAAKIAFGGRRPR